MVASKIDQKMSGLTAKFNDFAGEAVSYTPGGGSPRTISIMIEPDSFEQHDTGKQETECETMRAEVSVRNDTEGVATPKAGPIFGLQADKFDRDAKTWWAVALIGDPKAGFQKILFCTKLFNPFTVG